MENELIARYIYAVTRHLPPKMRPDVEKELDSLIADMLAERCGDILPTEKDVKAVLTELGKPEELAAKYGGEEDQALISGVNFIYYKQIIRIVLPIVIICVTIGNIIALSLNWDPGLNPFAQFGLAIGQVMAGIIGGLIFPFAIITFIFAVFERMQVRLDEGDMFSRLPPVPKGSEKIKPSEAIAGIIFSVAAAVVFLGFPEILGVWTPEAGWTPVFIPSVIRSLWMFIVLWAILSIIKESVKLIEGQFTKRLAVVNIACNVIILISVTIVFMNVNIKNPDFMALLNSLIVDEDGRTATAMIFGNINLIIVGGMALGLVVDSIVVAVNAYKSGK